MAGSAFEILFLCYYDYQKFNAKPWPANKEGARFKQQECFSIHSKIVTVKGLYHKKTSLAQEACGLSTDGALHAYACINQHYE